MNNLLEKIYNPDVLSCLAKNIILESDLMNKSNDRFITRRII